MDMGKNRGVTFLVIAFMVLSLAATLSGEILAPKLRVFYWSGGALDSLIEAGYGFSEEGALDESFLKRPKVVEHLWQVLLDPGCDERPDVGLLVSELEEVRKLPCQVDNSKVEFLAV